MRRCYIIICEYCQRITGHDNRCPNYTPPKTTCYCSFCDDGIYNGEEYIKNLDGEYCHYDCVPGMKDLLEWLGFNIKTMETIN